MAVFTNQTDFESKLILYLGADYDIITGDTSMHLDWMAMANTWLNRRLRVREMESTTDLTLVADTQTVALPTRFVGLRRLFLDGTPKKLLEYIPPQDFWMKRGASESGKPDFYTIEEDSVYFAPIPDTGYTGKILYWQGFEDLTAGSTTDLLQSYPDIYLYATLREAWILKGGPEADQKVTSYEILLEKRIDEINRSNQNDRFGKGKRVRADTVA